MDAGHGELLSGAARQIVRPRSATRNVVLVVVHDNAQHAAGIRLQGHSRRLVRRQINPVLRDRADDLKSSSKPPKPIVEAETKAVNESCDI
jgi:hypothetical protein